MRRGSALGGGVVGAAIVIYPVVLGGAHRVILVLASVALLVLIVALLIPRLPVALSLFCVTWAILYASALFLGRTPLDPFAPAMAAGLYLVVELGELTRTAGAGILVSRDSLSRRVAGMALVAGASVILALACLALSGLVRAGGLAGVVLAAACAAVVIAIATLRGLPPLRPR